MSDTKSQKLQEETGTTSNHELLSGRPVTSGYSSHKSKTSKQKKEDENTKELWKRMNNDEKLEFLGDNVLELYLNVKIRNSDESLNSEVVDDEVDKLKDVEPYVILEYIKQSIEILMNLKIEDHEKAVDDKVKTKLKDL